MSTQALPEKVDLHDSTQWSGVPPQRVMRAAVHELLNQMTGIKAMLDFLQIAAEEGAPAPGTFIGFEEGEWEQMMALAQGNCETAVTLLYNMYTYADSRPAEPDQNLTP